MKNNWVALIRWPLPPQATNNLFPLMMMMVRRLKSVPKKSLLVNRILRAIVHLQLAATFTGLEKTMYSKVFFGIFSLRQSRIKHARVMFMRKVGPIAPNFSYDF